MDKNSKQPGSPGGKESPSKVRTRRRTAREMEIDRISVMMLVAEGLITKEISDRLGMNVAGVRRLRAQGRAKRMLVVDESKVSDPELLDLARRQIHPTDVQNKLVRLATLAGVPPIKKYRCVFAVSTGCKSAWASRMSKFAPAACPVLMECLEGARMVGVTYGQTLWKTFEGADLKKLSEAITFFPTCCDSNRYQDEPWTSSNLARAWTRAQGKPGPTPSLIGTLLVSPMGGSEETRATLRRFTQESEGYQMVFGNGSHALIRQMDTLVTSIGRVEMPLTVGDDYLVRMVGIQRPRLNALLATEIGGIPIARKDLGKADRAEFEALDACRIGMTLADLERTARRAAEDSVPGVIVVATGCNKAEYFLELVRRGLVNIAIVDTELEQRLVPTLDALLEKLQKKASPRRQRA